MPNISLSSSEPAARAEPDAERVSRLLALANRCEEEGRLDDAEAVLDGLLAEMPDAAEAVHQKGIVAFRRGRTADAAALMERSLALAAGSAVFHRNLCEVYRALGRYREALVMGQRAVTLAPADPH